MIPRCGMGPFLKPKAGDECSLIGPVGMVQRMPVRVRSFGRPQRNSKIAANEAVCKTSRGGRLDPPYRRSWTAEQDGDGKTAPVGRGRVEDSIAVEVSYRHELRIRTRVVMLGGLEG